MDLHRPKERFQTSLCHGLSMVASARVELKSDQAEKGRRVFWLGHAIGAPHGLFPSFV
jgi:hypothetical protein